MVRLPAPLRPGDTIAVTAPSSGIPASLWPRLEFAVGWLRERGFRVELGACLDGSSHVSAPARERADELMAMLLDPRVRAVVPPWGGETAIDLVGLLDLDALRDAEPTWVVGFSDVSTLLTPLTVVAGWATLHAANLMDTPYAQAPGLAHWLDVASGAAWPDGVLRQWSPGVHRAGPPDRWEDDPTVTSRTWDGAGEWRVLAGAGPLDVAGRLVGGCLETLGPLGGSRFADTSALRGPAGDEPLLVYVEAAEQDAYSTCRALHGLRLAGFFDGAAAVMVGRTSAPGSPTLTQDDAVLDALAPLGVPVVADVDCGHVAPHLTLVNGAWGRLRHDGSRLVLDQHLDRLPASFA
ncbi:muramoyltetrapeptide carboxypeptidase LdcA involved in peptidoglycan recycling [Sediminihabitans luteus]|uniref:Muramoyltetrapeptide carboxypeptidase LdcA involved in peptidoglycan recycling n=1 Tax=Sediminihabitans luteus TaxID=1138585 RepID=A0A2M9D182_9CELL|nr:S66 peptidase family protein [Sediminihabitans luteus]PJJ77966.1 muramoyltetrapeptide carboxypeptidase LdcA involved in peptidoglycan recycling [Sediminihabitans luteus]GIJ00595.1 LD-carboxypeptidase [Sediminihabitans luteus]